MATKMVEVGTCVVHGLVPTWRMFMNDRPEVNTGPCCLACMIEYFKEHMAKVQDAHLVEITTP
jgi:hypothetical protein